MTFRLMESCIEYQIEYQKSDPIYTYYYDIRIRGLGTRKVNGFGILSVFSL